jgi:hypothetical protein
MIDIPRTAAFLIISPSKSASERSVPVRCLSMAIVALTDMRCSLSILSITAATSVGSLCGGCMVFASGQWKRLRFKIIKVEENPTSAQV